MGISVGHVRIAVQRLLGVVSIIGTVAPVSGQNYWNGTTGGIYYNGGNVGIGTTSPVDTLTIAGVTYYNSGLLLTGNSMCGTGLALQNLSSGAHQYAIFSAGSCDTAGAGAFGLYDDTANAYRLMIGATGNVGIGTTNPQQLLDVAGTIAAKEIIVTQTGADYVFQPDYRLTPLSSVGRFIQENHHLPGIPSAQEVQQKGLSIGEMQTKLLEKIEELTLHVIRQDERNTKLEQENRDLQAAIQAMKSDLARMEGERR